MVNFQKFGRNILIIFSTKKFTKIKVINYKIIYFNIINRMDYLKLSLVFLFGGILMILIYICSNQYLNTALSAILSLLPLSIISCYVMNQDRIIISHCKNLIPVLIITLISILLLILILQNKNINSYVAITGILCFWTIAQYLRIIYFPIGI